MAGGFAGMGGPDVSSVDVRFWAGFLLPTVWGFLSFRSGAADCRDSAGGVPVVEGPLVVPPVAQPASGSMRLTSSMLAE
jgi:hypothetical protein